MPLNMKVYICTDHTVFDTKEKPLRTGKYYFLVEELSESNNVKGKITRSNGKIEAYEFRYFSFLLMTVKAQSVLARRAKITDSRMPSYNSPVKPPKKVRPKYGNCCICLLTIHRSKDAETLPCKHNFHKKCIKEWQRYKKTCPHCRAEFNTLKIGKLVSQ